MESALPLPENEIDIPCKSAAAYARRDCSGRDKSLKQCLPRERIPFEGNLCSNDYQRNKIHPAEKNVLQQDDGNMYIHKKFSKPMLRTENGSGCVNGSVQPDQLIKSTVIVDFSPTKSEAKLTAEMSNVINCHDPETIAGIVLLDHDYACRLPGNYVEVQLEFGKGTDQTSWKYIGNLSEKEKSIECRRNMQGVSSWRNSKGIGFPTDRDERDFADEVTNANVSETRFTNGIDEGYLNRGKESSLPGKTNSQYNSGTLVEEVDLQHCGSEVNNEMPVTDEDVGAYADEIKVLQHLVTSPKQLNEVYVRSNQSAQHLRQRGSCENTPFLPTGKLKKRLREEPKQIRQGSQSWKLLLKIFEHFYFLHSLVLFLLLDLLVFTLLCSFSIVVFGVQGGSGLCTHIFECL